MVGFFSEPAPTAGSATADVRRVVCSPDLPLPAAAAVTGLPAAGATAEPYVAKLGLPPVRSAPATSKEPREDPYQCNVCQKTFAVPARLTRHYRTHTGERPFQCDFCDKKFGVKENLSVHRRIHTKERPYKCDVCARAFEHSGKLHRHMRIHTGERPHQCSVCRKTFIQSGQLVIHMRTHTGEKPYVCTVCHKGFTCSKQLKVHSRTHTGEKPYACDICGKSFGYNHVLKLHQVSHYGQKVYKCTLCQDTFTSKKTMEAHIKTHSDSSPQSPIVENMPSQIIQEVSTNSESSCASSITSDKENKDISIHSHPMEQNSAQQSQNQQQCYYLYPRSNESLAYLQPVTGGVNPALLAAAAVAAACEERPQSVSPAQNTMSQYGQYHHPSAYLPPQVNMNYEEVAPLDRGTDIRRRVEAALAVASTEEPILTPPSSNPVSPSPSVSPEPVEFVDCDRQVLILPPRKRSKAILKLMEGSNTVQPPAVRYSSVIQYAGAS